MNSRARTIKFTSDRETYNKRQCITGAEQLGSLLLHGRHVNTALRRIGGFPPGTLKTSLSDDTPSVVRFTLDVTGRHCNEPTNL